MTKKLLLIMFLVLLCPFVSATQLGMNYYHETMMSKEGWKYIPRTTTQIHNDLDDIKSITNYVKLYMNPMVSANQAWVNQINTIAKQKGMTTVIVMNTEDRTLDNSNWATYSSNVLANCQYFSTKANEFIVGNEISLHSTFSKTEIRNKVESLINTCKTKFSGTVSYEAFYYEKDAWTGYTGRLYMNMYENIASFTTNVKEVRAKFPNAYIGEWGEDLFDESTQRDENWQKTQIKARWDVIQQSNIPVAYIFTYKEPSYTGFGIVRADGTKRPAWALFGTITQPTTTPPSTGTTVTLPSSGCAGNSEYKICNKGSNTYEMYFLGGTKTYCYQTWCVSPSNGFVKFTTSSSPTPTPTPTPVPTTTGITLPIGTCQEYTQSGTKVKICDKNDGWYEMYLVTYSGTNFCYKTSCVGSDTGFARFTK